MVPTSKQRSVDEMEAIVDSQKPEVSNEERLSAQPRLLPKEPREGTSVSSILLNSSLTRPCERPSDSAPPS